MMMTMDAPDQPLTSYATPARRRGYINAMRQIAAVRAPGHRARVYFSVPPGLADRPNWQRRLDSIRHGLPSVELLDYRSAFNPDADYHEQWATLSDTLDGLVLTGLHRDKRRPREQTLGPIARQELITMVSAGRPVLLHSMEHGLVPVLDCRPKRVGQEPHQRLRLTIPRDWSPGEPTLQAALATLCPADFAPAKEAQQDVPMQSGLKSAHLTHPFTPPP
ncbi:hypothetical protein [Streptomyces monomycini]|uniref:hypothetical protein n=1 Tax=Streptomyces monomycini TaxID=371720 RepID=UPI0004AB5FC8|nr:hypothetical protein [Streptomyces monomycini]